MRRPRSLIRAEDGLAAIKYPIPVAGNTEAVIGTGCLMVLTIPSKSFAGAEFVSYVSKDEFAGKGATASVREGDQAPLRW